MRLPPRSNRRPTRRIYLTTGVSVASVGLVALSGAEAGDGGALKPWWIALSIVMSVVGAAVPGYEQIRKERLRKEAEQAAIEAAVEMRVTMNDALDPIVRQIGRIATATTRQERGNLREATVPMILDSAAHLIDAERVRACWFRFAPGKPRKLEPAQYAGRADEPVTVFEEGTVEGDSVFAMIRHNQHVVSLDVEADPPPGWHGSAQHGYRSFVAVPVVAGQRAFGILTVDAIDVAGVTEAEVPFVRLLAGLLADALAYGAPDEGLLRVVR
ncbi:GAF domain-containing protein [Actinoallomurus rhizosphaericola]|uniref:GAF domain-containing protein n=1 Tax=Actinoallomurus rhizosphaericola TaxID=2952536 RepID=UPI00209055CC|nr:GAF domain-containing protein [Actinoallomurus rhizosphaericola]MCO5993812.1 GAF domain-containing protein [Actinoallomurus rhizosphaericola]